MSNCISGDVCLPLQHHTQKLVHQSLPLRFLCQNETTWPCWELGYPLLWRWRWAPKINTTVYNKRKQELQCFCMWTFCIIPLCRCSGSTDPDDRLRPHMQTELGGSETTWRHTRNQSCLQTSTAAYCSAAEKRDGKTDLFKWMHLRSVTTLGCLLKCFSFTEAVRDGGEQIRSKNKAI